MILTDYRFAVGSYVVEAPAIQALLSYTNDQFDQDFIIFLSHYTGLGPFGSTFANSQLIAQGPGSVLSEASINSGFPYQSFPTHRLFLGFGSPTSSKRVFGNLMVSVSENAVPDPTIWAMLIAGFGIVGYALRRERETNLPSLRLV